MADFSQLNELLLNQINCGQLSHAYIFRGQQAMEQALSLAANLYCPHADYGMPCGSCTVCRNILAGTYPDCHIVEPDKGTHRLEGMKTLGAQAGLSSMDNGWKVFIITQAEKMSVEAANNLLKLLEEPPAQTVFILLTAQPEQLLPTVLSRCQLFIFTGDLNHRQGEIDDITLNDAISLLMELPKMHIYEVLLKAREKEKRDEQRVFLLGLLHALHSAAIGKISLPMAYASILRSATMVESSLELIDNNVNQKLLMDVVLLRLWQNCER